MKIKSMEEVVGMMIMTVIEVECWHCMKMMMVLMVVIFVVVIMIVKAITRKKRVIMLIIEKKRHQGPDLHEYKRLSRNVYGHGRRPQRKKKITRSG